MNGKVDSALQYAKSRGQTGLEYLMTYGWSLILIAAVIGIVIYVVSGSSGGVVCESQNSQIIVNETVFVPGDDSVGFTLQNATGNTIALLSDCVSSCPK